MPWPGGLLGPVDVRSKTDLRGYQAVGALLAKLAPDIVHAQDRRAGLVSSLWPEKSPVLLTFHGVPDNAAGRWVQAGPLHGRRPGVSGGSRLLADALVARRIGCTVAPSQAMAAFLHRELRVPRDRIAVVRNGVAIPPHHRPVHRHPDVCHRRFLRAVQGHAGLRGLPVRHCEPTWAPAPHGR